MDYLFGFNKVVWKVLTISKVKWVFYDCENLWQVDKRKYRNFILK